MALTSEAGRNDGLAFPFTYAAIAVSMVGVAPGAWLGERLLVDVLWRLTVGVAAGLVVGWALGRLFFSPVAERLQLAEKAEGFVALVAVFLASGVAELAEGCGFPRGAERVLPQPPTKKAALMGRLSPSVASEGFEPPKATPADLQSDPFGRLGNSPSCSDHIIRSDRRRSERIPARTGGKKSRPEGFPPPTETGRRGQESGWMEP
ncbi:MAG: sodium/hydrogen exchanger [Naasia sp.]|nr:sodium/hydrogen exchanger [Naasia sp.]